PVRPADRAGLRHADPGHAAVREPAGPGRPVAGGRAGGEADDSRLAAPGEVVMAPHELKERVTQVLAEEVGPALDLDGSAIEVLDVTGGVVQVRLSGVCAGCPSTVMTLLMGLEHELRQRVPEVEYLEAVP